MKKASFLLLGIWIIGLIGIIFSAAMLHREERSDYLEILSVAKWSVIMTISCLCFWIGENAYIRSAPMKSTRKKLTIFIVLLVQTIFGIIAIVCATDCFSGASDYWQSLKFITGIKIGFVFLIASILSA
ncbi:MAG: hypothetical protein IJ305_06185, partial [Oscillospiraceae bacterium]|nr:hypothetical protein [Oscillospiraceae bacterium]